MLLIPLLPVLLHSPHVVIALHLLIVILAFLTQVESEPFAHFGEFIMLTVVLTGEISAT